MNQALDRDFSFFSLLKFSFPTIIMMLFTSLYTIVDGIFVSRLVGPTALSAANIAYPLICVVMAVGFMLATGGSAIVARKLGEGDEAGARRNFSLLTLVAGGLGLVFTLMGIFLPVPLSRLLGAEGALVGYCADYLRVLLIAAPAFLMQIMFQSFFVTAGRPGLGLFLTVAAGAVNGVLDFLFMGPLQMGIAGAAYATAAGYLIPAGAGLIFFSTRRNGLRFARPTWQGRMLLHTCANGSSEMVTNLSNAVITYCFNLLMLRFLGEDGVAAITIVLYAQFLLTALYFGFSLGVAPILSFNHGAGNLGRLHSVFKSCMWFIGASSLAIFALSLPLSSVVVGVFSPVGTAVNTIAREGFLLFSPVFLFSGLSIFASAFFTAFSDGKTSAILSFLRTFAFILAGLLIMPRLWGVTGVWLAVPTADVLAFAVALWYLWRKRHVFHYALPSAL